MESVYRSIAGIDVHKKMLAVVIRRQCGEAAEYEKRKFGSCGKLGRTGAVEGRRRFLARISQNANS